MSEKIENRKNYLVEQQEQQMGILGDNKGERKKKKG